MKKLLITGYSLEFGGVEKALINLLKILHPDEYKITLLLQEKKGVFLKDVPSYVKVKQYRLCHSKIVPLRKIINRLHLLIYTIINHNKYDGSVCYATYDIPSSIIVKKVSKKSTLWIHSNYTHIYPKEKELKNFFATIDLEGFNQVVFVSEEAKNDLLFYYPSISLKSRVVNNLFDFADIQKKAMEEVFLLENTQNIVTVGRLEEQSKAFLRTFRIMKKFKEENKKIHLWVIGDGPDKEMLETYINENQIDNVQLLGSKSNPYPYIKKADLFILPSYYEGFPVVCIEALTLNKKIVTTIDVKAGSFSLRDYVFLCKQEEESIKNTIEYALNSLIKKELNLDCFYQEIKKETEKIIREGTI